MEGRLNFQLYRCDIDRLLRESRPSSPLRISELGSSSYEESSMDLYIQTESRMTSSFLDLYSTNEEESFEDVMSEGRVTSTLPLLDHADLPTYEELFEQNCHLFEGSDEEFESSCADLDAPEDLSLVDSPKGNNLCILRYCSVIELFSDIFSFAGTYMLDKGYTSHGDVSSF